MSLAPSAFYSGAGKDRSDNEVRKTRIVFRYRRFGRLVISGLLKRSERRAFRAAADPVVRQCGYRSVRTRTFWKGANDGIDRRTWLPGQEHAVGISDYRAQTSIDA